MAHIHKLIDFTISAFIVFDGKVLLVNHPRYGQWLPIGGHIELHEDPEQALFREIEEESGLKKENLELLNNILLPANLSPRAHFLPVPNFLDIHEANAPHRHISFTYFLHSKTGIVRLENGVHKAIRWFDHEDLEKVMYNLLPEVKFYCTSVLQIAKKF